MNQNAGLVLSYVVIDVVCASHWPRVPAWRAPRTDRPRHRAPDPDRKDPAGRIAASPARVAGEPDGAAGGDQGPGRQGAGRIAAEDGDSRAPPPRLAPPRPGRDGLAAGRPPSGGVPPEAD